VENGTRYIVSAKASAKAPREIFEEIMLIAETTIEFSAMEDDEIPENVSLATIRELASGAMAGMTPPEEQHE
jgi:hypothetical protein